MKKRIKNIISNIIAIVIILIAVLIYRKYDFNFYTKVVKETGKTVFSRDSDIKYSSSRSYKIENTMQNDAMFYKEISVKQNTAYKVTCMVKTENVVADDANPLAGAQICLNGTEEHSVVISGTQDWTELEFLFNSKCNDTVEIGFRLGGNAVSASGDAWFSDLSIEEGVEDQDSKWNFGCFIINNIDLTIDGQELSLTMTNYEKNLVTNDMERFQTSIKQMSNDQINIEYEIIEIDEPLTTLTYDEETGYYIGEKDAYNLINSYVQEGEYDHIFVCTNLPLESELTYDDSITEWIGLGNMIYIGKGFSNIKIIDTDLQYSSRNKFPEEVFLHEFLHTLERNAKEYGYTVPALHDYELYNYEEDKYEGLKTWYTAYMNKTIEYNGEYIGLPSEIYTLKPVQESNFTFSHQLNKLDEPKSLLENIQCIIENIKKLFDQNAEEVELQLVTN